ncbi:MAG: glycosyltransferase family 2 protein [Verrucomicrobia bacterium]|nr:glycosyltransferase family 2 protein [Verrucomicrobiota bacterium]
MKLSVVTTLYQSAPYVEEFYRRISSEMAKIMPQSELIFVNDGSTDDSLDRAVALQEHDKKVRVIDLSRNFGHHKAIMTGLQHSTGQLVFLIDVDLEEPPELLGKFYEVLKTSHADVVYGVQSPRHGPWVTRMLARLFYWVFARLSDYSIPPDTLTARLMSRRYVDELIRFREHLSNVIGLWELTGFEQVAVPVRKQPYKGTTTYTFRRRLAVAVYAITAFSSKPLRYIAYLGLIMTLISALYVVWQVIEYFIYGIAPTGWTSLIVSVWLLGGIMLFCLGIIATYLAVIFVEVKNRPYTVIRRIYQTQPRDDTRGHGA